MAGDPQVACFDTAFHSTLSPVAQRYALPEDLFTSGVRRYGFHGLSYEYVVDAVGPRELGRAVLAHLGSGASMVSVLDGRAVDTTMGFTPSGGLVMATRAGDIDPGLVVYLARQGYDAQALDRLVNNRAGMLALDGSTADVRELLSRRGTNPRAALALDVFVWSARKWLGAMVATIGGIDTLVFTGGIGEHAVSIRTMIASGLEYLGIHLDDSRNAQGDAVVSRDDSAVPRSGGPHRRRARGGEARTPGCDDTHGLNAKRGKRRLLRRGCRRWRRRDCHLLPRGRVIALVGLEGGAGRWLIPYVDGRIRLHFVGLVDCNCSQIKLRRGGEANSAWVSAEIRHVEVLSVPR